MTKLRPREVGYPTNRNGAHKLLVLHLLGLGFWLFKVFSYCSIIKRPLSLIVTQLRGMQRPHLFLEISYHHPSYLISIMFVSILQYLILMNEVLFMLHLCIYGYICNFLCSCLNLDQWYKSSMLFLYFSLHVPNEVGI